MLAIRVVVTYALSGLLVRAQTQEGDDPPRIIEHPSDTIVPRLAPVTLNCQAEGRPAPHIRWLKDGRRVNTEQSARVLILHGSLFFLTAARTDAGVYRCLAANRAGRVASRNVTLTVAVLREQFRTSPTDTVTSPGARAVLKCSPPKGDPPPIVRWRRDGVVMDTFSDQRYRISGEGDLVIERVTLPDAGEYVCEAHNYAGMERQTEPVQLIVQDLPPPPVNISASALNSTAAVIWWPAVPSPLEGGQPSGYRVYVQSDRGHWTRRHVEPGSTQVTLSDLTADTNYTIRVTTLASGGEGASSAPVHLHLPAPPPPSATLAPPPPSTTLVPPTPSDPTQDVTPQMPQIEGHVWLAVVVAVVVFLTLFALAVAAYVRRRHDKRTAGCAAEKRGGCGSLLPAAGSWPSGATCAHTGGSSCGCGQYAELSCRSLQQGPPCSAPTPYATTALLDPQHSRPGGADSWNTCYKPRIVSTPTMQRANTLQRTNCCNSGVRSGSETLYSRPHRFSTHRASSISTNLDQNCAENAISGGYDTIDGKRPLYEGDVIGDYSERACKHGSRASNDSGRRWGSVDLIAPPQQRQSCAVGSTKRPLSFVTADDAYVDSEPVEVKMPFVDGVGTTGRADSRDIYRGNCEPVVR